MAIDTHAHYIPQAMIEDLRERSSDFPNVELIEDDGKFQLAFAGNKPTRPIMPRLRETEERKAWMDEHGLDIQLPGGWVDAFGNQLPADEGAAWARYTNQWLLKACADEPRLIPLGVLPTQSGKHAAEVMAEALDQGFKGFMIGAQTRAVGGNLDDPDLDPFWQMAHDRGAVIMVHPVFDVTDKRVLDYDMVNAVGRINDLTTAMARILFTGHLTKYSNAKIIASTGGAALPYALGRLTRNFKAHAGQYADPREGFAQLYFDSIVFEPEVLDFLVARVGVDKVMLGSDWPFPIGDMEPRKVVDNSSLSQKVKDAILEGNAISLFGL
jgi:aminocarboxymuconate-semialdehyde decarboxylase